MSSYDYLSHAQREREQRDRRNAIKVLAIIGISLVVVTGAVISSSDDDEPEEVVADCVIATQQPDGTYEVVDDRFCDDGSHAAYYYWLYGSSTSNRAGYVRGSTRTRPADAQITTRVGKVIQRGGFGGGSRSGKGGGG